MASCIQIKSLLQAYLDDELGSGEKLLFEDHLHGCVACRKELERVRAVNVRLFELLGRDRLRDDLVPQIMAHLPEMEGDKRFFTFMPHKTTGMNKKASWPRVAAKMIPVFVPLILLILGGVLWLYWPSVPGEEASFAGVVTYSKGPAEMGLAADGQFKEVRAKDFVVPDSLMKTGKGGRLLFGLLGPSHATLYENAYLRLVNERKLVLEQGRIFLDVHRESRQFHVTTPHGAITVLGTSFEVNTGMQGTEVTVVNGEVLVENETGFALLSRGSYALFGKSGSPEVRKGVPADRCLEMARSVLPDASAERLFLSRFVSQPTESSSVRRQIFMVETQRRAVSAVELRWLPDPYSEGHAGYNIFVSDSALNPLFKATIAREVFQDKTRNSIRITVPPEMQEQADTRLHIDLLPDYTSGGLETSFTEVRAIGVRP